jgi:hypothetical protein
MGELAAVYAGGVAAGIYPTDTPAQVAYKAEHSAAVGHWPLSSRAEDCT